MEECSICLNCGYDLTYFSTEEPCPNCGQISKLFEEDLYFDILMEHCSDLLKD